MKLKMKSNVGPERTTRAESKEYEAMKVNKERRLKRVSMLTAVFCALYFLVTIGPALSPAITHPSTNST